MKTTPEPKTIPTASLAPARARAPHGLRAKAHPPFACHSKSHPGPQPVFPASSPLPTSQAGLLTLPLTRLKHSHLHTFPPTWNALPIPVSLLCARHYAECFRLLTPRIWELSHGASLSSQIISMVTPKSHLKQSKYRVVLLCPQFQDKSYQTPTIP